MIPLYDHNPTHRVAFLTYLIIAVNVLVYFGWQTRVGLEEGVALAAFVPAELTKGGAPHVLTSMFMHGSIMHLLGNMWFLWIFGDNIENECGHFWFGVFYLLTGVAATLAHTLTDPSSHTPLVGASGAISGVLGGYLVRHPTARIRTLLPLGLFTRILDVPAFVFLFVWLGLQVVNQFARTGGAGGGGVAYLAHIGGFVAGVALIFVFGKRRVPER